MKKNYRSIAQLFGIVFLLTLLLTPVVSAQPAMQYLNIVGTAFNAQSSTQTYDNAGTCLFRTNSDNNFIYPLSIPNGSTIKYLQQFYFDSNPATLSSLSLRKYDPSAGGTYTVLSSVASPDDAGYGNIISSELNITVDTTCTADPQCFYALYWSTLAVNNTVRICGARVHYIPPFGALALPLIQRN